MTIIASPPYDKKQINFCQDLQLKNYCITKKYYYIKVMITAGLGKGVQ
jgi:hypothetical protein